VWRIFGDNLFESIFLFEEFAALLGLRESKPLECVGTALESRAALRLSAEQYRTRFAGRYYPMLLLDREIQSVLPPLHECEALLADVFRGETLIPEWLHGLRNHKCT
jgi:hypothetical protein